MLKRFLSDVKERREAKLGWRSLSSSPFEEALASEERDAHDSFFRRLLLLRPKGTKFLPPQILFPLFSLENRDWLVPGRFVVSGLLFSKKKA